MTAYEFLIGQDAELTKDLRANADPELLWELYKRRVPRWISTTSETEYGTMATFSDLGTISPADASKLIPKAFEILVAQTERTSIAIAFSLLTQLAKSSASQILPPLLAENWRRLEIKQIYLEDRFKRYWDELRWWYRSNPQVVSIGRRVPDEWVFWEQPFTFEEAENYIRETAFLFSGDHGSKHPWQLQELESLRAIAIEGDVLYKYSVTRVCSFKPGSSGWVLARGGNIVGTFVECHHNALGS